jgi:cell division protein FtsQ
MIRPTIGFVCATVLIASAIGFAVASIDGAVATHISVVGSLDEAQLVDIKEILSAVNLAIDESDTVRQVLVARHWVHHVNVRKSWPSAIEIEVHAEKVIAYWNDDGFINEQGEVLVTDLLVGGELPLLYGPQGSEFEVMTQYQQLGPMLNKYGHELKLLKVSDRGSWSMETKQGIDVLLGKEDLKARMQRFLTVSDRLRDSTETRSIERMDARYINGVAVHFAPNNRMKLAENNNQHRGQSL